MDILIIYIDFDFDMSFNGFSILKIARDTQRLAATMDVEHTNVRFLNNLTLNLWDCGI